MQGYKTVIANLVALLAAWLNNHYQIVVDPDSQIAITATLLTLVNIGLRLLTKTPVFNKETGSGTSDKAKS